MGAEEMPGSMEKNSAEMERVRSLGEQIGF